MPRQSVSQNKSDKTACKPLPDLTPADIERYWKYVDVRGPDECWPWKGKAHHPKGYGALQVKRRPIRAPRIAWKLAHGRDPYPFDVLHHCDNPPCCNPKHIYRGRHKRNVADAKKRHRYATGDKHGLRLHPERAATGDRNASRLYPERRPKGTKHYNASLTEEQVWDMYRAWDADPNLSKIEHARKLSVKRTMFSDIILGRKWKELWKKWKSSPHDLPES